MGQNAMLWPTISGIDQAGREQQALVERQPAITMKGICKDFGAFRAVDHLSLSIKQGEVFGLLGPNGSGKTTTITMLSGLSQPTVGDIRILGFDPRRGTNQIRRLLGIVWQETALYEELTAWDNLDFHADLYGISSSEKPAGITSMLTLTGLLDSKDKRVKTFSGGMKRRLAIGRALLHSPQLIYLDEPTLGVDVQSRHAIWSYIRALREQGRTILLTTNYLEEAQALCDRLAIIDHGKLRVVDTPAHLKQVYGGSVVELELWQPCQEMDILRSISGVTQVRQAERRLFIAVQDDGTVLPQIMTLFAREGAIRTLKVRESTLDDVFLRLTGKALRD